MYIGSHRDYTHILYRVISGNLISHILDHLPNFILVGNKFNDPNLDNNRPYMRIMSDKNIRKFKLYLMVWSYRDVIVVTKIATRRTSKVPSTVMY